MSTSGVAALDHTVQETNAWLRAVAEQLHFEDRQHAYLALRAVLHALRDRLPPEVAVNLGAQLPILVRGVYYEGWHMAGKPTKDRSVQEFADHVLQGLPPRFPMDPLTVTRGVFEILWERLDAGEFAKLMDHLPTPLRTMRR
ncbi:DUF2267 domain-containing protein [Bradyrhizobium sediminis]|uniref:DUF2267 domain-containing protein n=1 Tax=Bradyrhizobium sediminis TaxID=2840469 RepID=A0A975NMA0_9BRAD|nr:DUF2267 domain-containing protein [Bradyrhizobium sediminis]QWG17707.1 DUF2267 domain-containing protein [Bradyrhizobium sediminis]